MVQIPVGDAVLKAVLYKPEGAGPFPAIVALHGCWGLAERSGRSAAHVHQWGERFKAAGFVVLFPDSFGSRGLGSQCRTGRRTVRASRERVADANAARGWLQSQDYVVSDRISIVGWSHGGVSLLWAVRPRAAAKDGKPDFRAAVAFYPGCRRLADTAWSARVPTLVLIGRADDWTPAKTCEQMVTGARGRSAQVSIITYPGAHHAFDHPDLPLAVRSRLAFTPDGSGRAHTGTHPAARENALQRVPDWLARISESQRSKKSP